MRHPTVSYCRHHARDRLARAEQLSAWAKLLGTVDGMATARLRCTTADGQPVKLGDVVRSVYNGDTEPDTYDVQLDVTDDSAPPSKQKPD